MGKDIMVIGLGWVGRYALDYLLRYHGKREILVADVKEGDLTCKYCL